MKYHQLHSAWFTWLIFNLWIWLLYVMTVCQVLHYHAMTTQRGSTFPPRSRESTWLADYQRTSPLFLSGYLPDRARAAWSILESFPPAGPEILPTGTAGGP
jgi:hypothetical protein